MSKYLPKIIAGVLLVVIAGAIAYAGVHKDRLSDAARKPSGGTVQNTLAFTPSSGKIAAGNPFVVTLVENSGTEPINAVQAKVTYDVARLEFVGAEEAGVFDVAAATDSKVPGIIQIARGTTSGAKTGENPIVKLTFTTKSGANGSAGINVDTASSYIVRASDSTNILTGSSPATITIRGK